MKPNKILVLFVLLAATVAFGQNKAEQLLLGKVVADLADVEGINVVNLVNEKATVTDKNGAFSILAKADDLLVFSAVNLEYHRRLIEFEDFNKEVIIIRMIPQTTQLKEVVINEFSQINAEALGIIPAGQKKYTPAERKMFTAQSGPVDIVANLISGRKKMLKKELEVEKREILLSKVESLYGDEYYLETLTIPEDHIQGFQYYVIENRDFVSALHAKNKTLLLFLTSKLAVEYKSTLKL